MGRKPSFAEADFERPTGAPSLGAGSAQRFSRPWYHRPIHAAPAPESIPKQRRNGTATSRILQELPFQFWNRFSRLISASPIKKRHYLATIFSGPRNETGTHSFICGNARWLCYATRAPTETSGSDGVLPLPNATECRDICSVYGCS